MKLTSAEDRIHVLDRESNAWSVLRDIAESGLQEDAFYVCDIGEIVRKHHEWIEKLPRVYPHFAVKSNDSGTVLQVLAALGTGFDCASKVEIDKVLSLGVDTSRIIFANPAKPASHIRHAAATGVDLMTFDNETELHKVKSLFPSARLVIRIRCDAAVAQCALGMKFGCDALKEAPHLLRVAAQLGLSVVGVSFHVGSGCREPAAFHRAIGLARMLWDLAPTLGHSFSVLDVGGGFPGDRGTSIDEIANVINSALDEYFPDPDVHVIAEPGRFFVAAAYTLATCIHSLREVLGSDHVMYYVNDGVYGSFNGLLYDHATYTPVPLNPRRGEPRPCSVWGPTCDGLDQIVEHTLLPPMTVGDWVVFENMGAYTLPVASTFNGFPLSRVHTVVDERIWQLLKNCAPLSEAHFELGHDIANLLIRPQPTSCVQDHTPFLFEFVKVGP